MSTDFSTLLQTAIYAAREAASISLRYFQSPQLRIERKEDDSPVTIADREAEEAITSIIRSRFPDHAILGEEFGTTEGDAPIRWIVDPIDGTKSFICGVPLYGTLIGVEVEGQVRVGVVNFPALGELYYATEGGGAYLNGQQIHVSTTDELEKSVLLVTSERGIREHPKKGAPYLKLAEQTFFQRTWGDCYGHMLVASGRAEIMLEAGMHIWDSAPLKVIVEEAGGIFTDWQNQPDIAGGDAISTNHALGDNVRSILGVM